eukprot:8326751-Pyramimonas_sp.AAC.2
MNYIGILARILCNYSSERTALVRAFGQEVRRRLGQFPVRPNITRRAAVRAYLALRHELLTCYRVIARVLALHVEKP